MVQHSRFGSRLAHCRAHPFGVVLIVAVASISFGACGSDDGGGGGECVACDQNPGGMDNCPDLCPDENKAIRKCQIPPHAAKGCCITEGTVCQ